MMDSTNNLNGLRTYLVGAMDRVTDGGTTWRQQITPHLDNLGIKILNPCLKLANKVSEEDAKYWIEYYKEKGEFDKIRKEFGAIRTIDLRCVDISDFIIAHIDINNHACGTYEEITTANRQKKPVLVWCEQGKKKAPNWLFFMLPHHYIFSSMQEVIDYLYNVNNTTNISQLKRWLFFPHLYD